MTYKQIHTDYALKDINLNKLDLKQSFYFDTNVHFPSITSVLRKITRFTNRKDIFDLHILSDPKNAEFNDIVEIARTQAEGQSANRNLRDSVSQTSSFYSSEDEDEQEENQDAPEYDTLNNY